MTVFEAWLSKLDLSTLGVSALTWFVILGFGWFMNRKVWPWFTTDFFPSRIKRDTMRFEAELKAEQQRTAVLDNIRDAMISLTMLSQQQMLTLREHDHKLTEILTRTNIKSTSPADTHFPTEAPKPVVAEAKA